MRNRWKNILPEIYRCFTCRFASDLEVLQRRNPCKHQHQARLVLTILVRSLSRRRGHVRIKLKINYLSNNQTLSKYQKTPWLGVGSSFFLGFLLSWYFTTPLIGCFEDARMWDERWARAVCQVKTRTRTPVLVKSSVSSRKGLLEEASWVVNFKGFRT